MTRHDEEEGVLFDAAPDVAKDGGDLLDELREVNAGAGDQQGLPDPWLVVLDAASAPIWKAVMGDLVSPGTRAEQDAAAAALEWHRAGFTPDEARDWITALDIESDWHRGAELASEWQRRGFTPDEARPWLQGDISPGDDAAHSTLFRDAGWHPYSVWALYTLAVRGENWDAERRAWASMPESHALNCARAGLAPLEAVELIRAETQWLEEHLTTRFQSREKIDPFLAMLFNHHIVPWEGEEVDHPFWARRIWDLHDESDDESRQRGEKPMYGGPRAEKPRWKIFEERAEREERVASQPKSLRCSNSGGPGQLEFRDGMEDWFVHCPECGATWMGGGGDVLPEHNRPRP